jgi:hypothetical protein
MSGTAEDRDLLAAHSEGLVCLSGCLSSEFSRSLVGAGAAPRAEWDRGGRLNKEKTPYRRPSRYKHTHNERPLMDVLMFYAPTPPARATRARPRA